MSVPGNGQWKMSNAQLASTGPRTAEGLARSHRARWKQGLYSAEALAEQKRVRDLLAQSRDQLAKRRNRMLTDRKVVTLFQARYNTSLGTLLTEMLLITREGNARVH
jgi:hypothetical protein